MPGSVANASATTVLPQPLGGLFRRSREWSIQSNEYRDGRSQRDKDVATSRKAWVIDQILTATQLTALRDFYEARSGMHEPWIFYDVQERLEEGVTPLYDPTGVAGGAGKYVCRFLNSTWLQIVPLGRKSASISFIEVT